MTDSARPSVAIIGAGPAGLVAARWLLAKGLKVVLFEASDRLGGQWNAEGRASATWPGMRTNTSRVMTAFADLDHPEGTPTYPRQDQMLGYLERYADAFGLRPLINLSTRVEAIERGPGGGWRVRVCQGRIVSEGVYTHVVVATGRQAEPAVPQVNGLDTFTGARGVAHSAQYRGAAHYRGASMLVVGGSVSALEIAADLAYGGAASVTLASRRQRYVLPKIVRGVPTEHILFTRAAARAGEVLPMDAQAEGLKATVLALAGSPAQFGAPAPDPNIFAAGISQAQNVLPAVAEGRIVPHGALVRIDGRTAHFAGGTDVSVDGILFGTGYRLSLPFLSPEIRTTLGLDDTHIDLYAHTFHPELPGFAFVGLYDIVGPAFPVLELQARWLAYTLSGTLPAPSRHEMEAGLDACRAAREGPQSHPMHVLALAFARLCGVEPDLRHYPDLERALLFGPLSPASFRLTGPDAQADAEDRIRYDAAAFGHILETAYAPEERALRDLVLGMKRAA